MQIQNTSDRFGIIAILFHWGMAILLIGLVVLGLYMNYIPISAQKLKLYGWHKEWGIAALMLALFRIIWSVSQIHPSLAALQPMEKMAARTVHRLFYFFMFALPISGWLMTSAAGLPVSFFGFFLLPDLVSSSEENRLLLQTIHTWLGYGLILIFFAHVSAAMKHHLINKDTILRRMLP